MWQKFEKFYIDLRDETHQAFFDDYFIQDVRNYLSKMEHHSGERNMWIVKPCASSKGRGIKVFNCLKDITNYSNVSHR